MKNVFVFIAAVLLLCGMVTGCFQNAGPPVSVEDLADFFVNPSPAKLAALSGKTCDTAGLSAAFRTIRGTPDTGTVRVWMIDSAGFSYRLGYSTPSEIRRDTTYPLIIYLHGGIGTERNDKGDSAFLMLSALADTFRLFLASPSADRFAPWWSPIGLSRILQTLRYMTLRYPVNRGKIFLAGVSDGATGCYAAANSIPAPFAGFIAVSGFGGMLPMLGMRLEPGNLKQRPIYNVNAGLDHIYPVEEVKEFVRLMQEQGVWITSRIYPEEKHGFDYRMKEMGALANLVRTWTRPESPDISWAFVPEVPNLPDNCLSWTLSSDNASVHAFWRHDTLMVRAKGVQSLTASFLSVPAGVKIPCRMLADDETVRVKNLSPVKIKWPQEFQFMAKRCFPEFTGMTSIYTMKFK
jgi:acetyl esterase/lipase